MSNNAELATALKQTAIQYNNLYLEPFHPDDIYGQKLLTSWFSDLYVLNHTAVPLNTNTYFRDSLADPQKALYFIYNPLSIRRYGYEILNRYGYAGFHTISEDKKEAHVAVLVNHNMRGNGIGRTAIQSLIHIAKSVGIKTLEATVNKNNTPSLTIFKREFQADLTQAVGQWRIFRRIIE
jgi:GNAT superfamily N-acetyltransferase